MKSLLVILSVALLFPGKVLGDPVYPAATNKPNTFFFKNYFLGDLTVSNHFNILGTGGSEAVSFIDPLGYLTVQPDAGTIIYGDVYVTGFYHGDGSALTNLPTSKMSSPTNSGLMDTNLWQLSSQHRSTRRKLSTPFMGTTGGSPGLSYDDVIIMAQYLNTNGYADLGFNTIVSDGGWASNNLATGDFIFISGFAPSGITNLIADLATNRCYLGLHLFATNSYNWPTNYPPFIWPAVAYTQGYQFASWGVRHVWLDSLSTQPGYSTMVREFARGADDGAHISGHQPLYIYVASGRADALTNTYQPEVANVMYVGLYDDGGSTNPVFRANLMLDCFNYPSFTGPGIVPSPGPYNMPYNTTLGGAWWNTNYARANIAATVLCPTTFWVTRKGGENGFLDPTLPLIRNKEIVQIHQDPMVAHGGLLSTNLGWGTNYSWQKVMYRPMSDGDVALGLWNTYTNDQSIFNVDLTKVPGAGGDYVMVRDIFGNLTFWTNRLNVMVNTGGCNLYRLSRAKPNVVNSIVVKSNLVMNWMTVAGFIQVTNNGIVYSIPMMPDQVNPAAGFYPSNIANLRCWYTVNGVTGNDGDSKTWADSSGNGATMGHSSVGSRPYWTNNVGLNGKGAMVFAGANWLTNGIKQAWNDFTAFVAYNPITSTGGAGTWCVFTEWSFDSWSFNWVLPDALMQGYVNNVGVSLISAKSNAWHAAVMRRTGNSVLIKDTDGNTGTATSAGATGTGRFFSIGANDSGGSAVVAKVTEAGFYDVAITDDQMTTLLNYLKTNNVANY